MLSNTLVKALNILPGAQKKGGGQRRFETVKKTARLVKLGIPYLKNIYFNVGAIITVEAKRTEWKSIEQSDVWRHFDNHRIFPVSNKPLSFSQMHFSFHFLVRAAAGNIQVLQTFNSLLIRRREKVGLYLETKWNTFCFLAPQGALIAILTYKWPTQQPHPLFQISSVLNGNISAF